MKRKECLTVSLKGKNLIDDWGNKGEEFKKLLESVKWKEGEEEGESDSTSADRDSGVDLSNDASTAGKSREDVEKELQNWMLAAIKDQVADLAPVVERKGSMNVQEWYNVHAHYFEVVSDGDELAANELEEEKELPQCLSLPSDSRALQRPLPWPDHRKHPTYLEATVTCLGRTHSHSTILQKLGCRHGKTNGHITSHCPYYVLFVLSGNGGE